MNFLNLVLWNCFVLSRSFNVIAQWPFRKLDISRPHNAPHLLPYLSYFSSWILLKSQLYQLNHPPKILIFVCAWATDHNYYDGSNWILVISQNVKFLQLISWNSHHQLVGYWTTNIKAFLSNETIFIRIWCNWNHDTQ